ncbi:MAG TPA: DUF6520 family protein [Chitinophagaceae bacterium]|nr:DUF6520 family protein [Chitinophagaceae bacterium]
MKGKIFLSALALCAAVGSAFAIKNVAAGDVWYRNPISGQYTLVCEISGATQCAFAPVATNNAYYVENPDGSRTLLANGTSLFARP